MTLRELEAMGRAKLTADWDRQAPLLALLHEQTRWLAAVGKFKIPPSRSPADFHPLRGEGGGGGGGEGRGADETAASAGGRGNGELPKLPVTALKQIFCRAR